MAGPSVTQPASAPVERFTELYNGQVIEAAPEQLSGTWGDRWTFRGAVIRGEGVIPFDAGTTMYVTRQDAIDACLRIGRHIVDGNDNGYAAQFEHALTTGESEDAPM